ncbi:MAG TPA: hypothetical protein VN282_27790 [Pyrinomonadaceae bacterium]|nr:hypothetical protein [Pyrinomonadaceae bacterium]
MEKLVRAVGVLACLMSLAGGVVLVSAVTKMLAGQNGYKFKGKARGLEAMPALAMGFVDDAGDVQGFLDSEDGKRAELRRGLAFDNVFIVAYWLLFAGLSVLLARRDFSLGGWNLAVWLAAFAALCATGAAVSDVVENARTTALLDAAEVTGPLVTGVAAASFWKWLLISLATLALSTVFMWGGDSKVLLWGGGLFLLYALIGLLTLAGILGGLPRLVAFGFLLNFLGLLGIAVLFTAWPRWVVGRL